MILAVSLGRNPRMSVTAAVSDPDPARNPDIAKLWAACAVRQPEPASVATIASRAVGEETSAPAPASVVAMSH